MDRRLDVGAAVKIVGTSRGDLNGLTGKIVSYDATKERYLVQLESNKVMTLKHQNLQNVATNTTRTRQDEEDELYTEEFVLVQIQQGLQRKEIDTDVNTFVQFVRQDPTGRVTKMFLAKVLLYCYFFASTTCSAVLLVLC